MESGNSRDARTICTRARQIDGWIQVGCSLESRIAWQSVSNEGGQGETFATKTRAE